MLDMDDAENLRIIFPYPSEARDDRLVICNNAGTVYYFYAKHTQIYHPIQPVQEDGKCTFLNVTDLCPMGPCDAWEMGVVKACETAALMHCRNLSCHYVSFVRVPSAGSKTHADAIVFATGNSWTCAEDEIQPGITVIPGGAPQPPTPCCFFFVRGCVVCWKCESEPEVCRAGVSRASCAVLCPKGQAECNSGVIVFIPPVNCFETEIYHNTENAGTLPEGFEQ
eukprot:795054-Rhodomonas_salina.1